jgi:hypothetical protein
LFSKLAYDIGGSKSEGLKLTSLEDLAVENVERFIVELGFVGPKFDRALEAVRVDLHKKDSASFERGLSSLGKMLGYRASKPDEIATPDSVWELGNTYFALLEAKSDESPQDLISVSTCRQASGHRKWLAAQPFVPHNADPTVVVISPRSKVDKAAIPHAAGLHYLSPVEVQALFNEAAECLRAVRSKAADLDSNDRLRVIAEERTGRGLDHEHVSARLAQKELQKLTS